MAATWLDNAVFYEIYPQSFMDSNADGIGDIPGMTAKLDYVQGLGCNALWINPCFDSPFQDAGYDIRDYKLVAPRYGTNEDLIHFFEEAHRRGIRVLLDLVPCHTSETHPWFQESCREAPNAYSDRYIWTDCCWEQPQGLPFVGGEMPRDGCYILSFFKCQPALNFGFSTPTAPWQHKAGSPATLDTRQAIWDVMRFWLEQGCDGFRVDMAGALVKNDTPDQAYTQAVYRDLRERLDREFPEAALVSEWNAPRHALGCGFDMDFYLSWTGNGYHSLMRSYDPKSKDTPIGPDRSYFKADSGADPMHFLGEYLPNYLETCGKGLWCFLTCNHDTVRPRFNLTPEELKLAYSFLFTMPGAPFLYYGDEIGMRYRRLPSKEGGYNRTGSRTPMQWSAGKNLGFSESEPEKLYLPVDPAADAPTVQAQEADPNSLLNYTKAIIALRHSQPDLQARSPFQVYFAQPGSRLLAYRRGRLLCAVNPGHEEQTLELDRPYRILFSHGPVSLTGRTLHMQGFAVLAPQ